MIITDLDNKIEIGPGVTASIPFEISDDFVAFQVYDIDAKTQDLALSCWFSETVPFENPVRFVSFDLRRNVQQKKSLILYGKSSTIDIPEDSPNGHIVTLENGQYFMNIQNRAGQYKKFIVKKNFLNN